MGRVKEVFAVSMPAKSRIQQVSRVERQHNRNYQVESLKLVHDLRSPLTAIMGFLEIVSNAPNLTREQRNHLGTASRTSEALSELISRLLDVGESCGTESPIVTDCHNLLKLVRDSIDEFEPELTNRSQQISLKIRYDAGEFDAECDPLLIRRVISNVISNAIKYSPGGSSIGVAIWSDYHRIVIEIADNGYGMTLDETRHAFEPFYRGESEADADGTGLGLSVVGEIVASHNGDIRIESTPNVGTLVTIELPRCQPG